MNDHYYLVTFSERSENFIHFRVDHMDDTQIDLQNACHHKAVESFDVNEYKKKMFLMYTGECREIGLLVHNSLIDTILDKFGQDILLHPYDKMHFKLNVAINVSQSFFAWCFMFKDKIKVISPQSVVDKIKEYADDFRKNYE